MKVKLFKKRSVELYGGELIMAQARFQDSNTKRVDKKVLKTAAHAFKGPHFLICTPIFWTALSCFLATTFIFAFAITNSVLLAREDRDLELHEAFSVVVYSLAASGFIHSVLHLWFGRFDSENKRQRLWLHIPLLMFFAAFIVHNVFWYLGVKFEPDSFPYPNSASYSVVGFAMCFIIAFSCWYQMKYVKRLYI